jgi:hypothetical protein
MEEDAFHLAVFGCPVPGERGERTAALRWGNLFDSRLAEANAAALLDSLHGQLGINPGTAIVRNLRQEVPGTKGAAVAERHRRTREVIADLIAGSLSCDVLLQPTLELAIPNLPPNIVIPDALVLDRASMTFVPLEAKAYVAKNGITEPGDRDDVRRQAAVEIHALRAEFSRQGEGHRVDSRALLVLGTPFGLKPHPAVLEDLAAEDAAVDRAIHSLSSTASRLTFLLQTRPLPDALRQLPFNFQSSCLTSCGMAHACRLRAPGLTGPLGDRATQVLGASLDPVRVLGLLAGAPPDYQEEANLLSLISETTAVFGWDQP